jgi:hypothetical protein
MTVLIPLTDVATQQVSVTVANQQCQINIYTRDAALYCDLYVAHTPIITGVRCLNLTKIVRDTYLGFTGDIYFYDTQGVSDPSYPGLGSRYQLVYS